MMKEKKIILVIEDSPRWRKILKNLFEHHGYKVETFDRKDGATNQIHLLKPHLILIDIELHGNKFAGFEIAKEIESYEIPFAYLTTHYNTEYIEKAYQVTIPRPLAYLNKSLFDSKDADTEVAKLMSDYKRTYKDDFFVSFGGYQLEEDKILYIEKKTNTDFVIIHLQNNTKIEIAKTLKECEEKFTHLDMINGSQLVNLSKVTNYEKHYLHNRTTCKLEILHTISLETSFQQGSTVLKKLSELKNK